MEQQQQQQQQQQQEQQQQQQQQVAQEEEEQQQQQELELLTPSPSLARIINNNPTTTEFPSPTSRDVISTEARKAQRKYFEQLLFPTILQVEEEAETEPLELDPLRIREGLEGEKIYKGMPFLRPELEVEKYILQPPTDSNRLSLVMDEHAARYIAFPEHYLDRLERKVLAAYKEKWTVDWSELHVYKRLPRRRAKEIEEGEGGKEEEEEGEHHEDG